MKVLAWILTAAAILIGADVFVKNATTPNAPTEEAAPLASMEGGNGIPPVGN